MVLAEVSVAQLIYWFFWLALLVAWVSGLVMLFFVIWSRKDWAREWRVVATVLMAVFGLFLPGLALMMYIIVDVITRKDTDAGIKTLWIVVALLSFGFAAFAYFIWALRHKPQVEPSVDQGG
jgi:hypothetical protein